MGFKASSWCSWFWEVWLFDQFCERFCVSGAFVKAESDALSQRAGWRDGGRDGGREGGMEDKGVCLQCCPSG